MRLCHGLLFSIIDPGPARDQINKLGTKVLILAEAIRTTVVPISILIRTTVVRIATVFDINGVKIFINLVQMKLSAHAKFLSYNKVFKI